MTRFLATLALALVVSEVAFAGKARGQTNFRPKNQLTWRQRAVSINGNKAIITYTDATGRVWTTTNSVTWVNGIAGINYY